jgi:hypothetical protein
MRHDVEIVVTTDNENHTATIQEGGKHFGIENGATIPRCVLEMTLMCLPGLIVSWNPQPTHL